MSVSRDREGHGGEDRGRDCVVEGWDGGVRDGGVEGLRGGRGRVGEAQK